MAGRSRTNVPATVYKDFQPQIDRKEEQGANLLAIHLPDFPKEQLNVTYVDATRSIKVQAEKAVEKNTRSRFNQDFPVPENCIIEKIQASFRNGILTITMPKRLITHHLPLDSPKQITPPKPTTPPPSSSTSTSAVQKQRDQKLPLPPKPPTTTAPKPTAEPKPPTATAPKPTAEPKPPTAPKPISEPRPTMAKPITEPKPPMTTPTAPKPISEPRPPIATVAKPITEPKPPMVTAPQIPKQQTKRKEVEALPPLKQQEEIQRKVSAIAKQTEEEKAGGSLPTPTPEIVEKNSKTKDGLKDLVDKKAKDSVPEAADIAKASVKADSIRKMPKEGGRFLEMTGMDTIMKTVKRLATDDAEDRQLLINIGVSVLVIVALGAYITYSYRSSGKAKN
ncbi:hypothetical protein HRI_001146200 [Hibiscus trionum]|uniref:SHSP domain-containing protein n=1 Tax=Hibiscus trionum TaxID=183268 RepID=A0A9W7HC55_HIBTR|nr:hypothetical protein HRI_001146200 [Hibiscus trionum]